MRQLLRRVWYLIRQRRFDADLREELEFHRAATQRELEQSGTDPTSARFATRRALGSVALAQDQARDVWRPRWLQGIGQDFRLAFRTLRATPIVTAIAVVSLALGIGADTAIFSLINSLLFRSLPVADPQQLVVVTTDQTRSEGLTAGWGYDLWTEMQHHAGTFDGVAAWSGSGLPVRFNLARSGEIDAVDGEYVSGDFFSTLGVPALLGRTFTPADDVRGGTADGAVAIISYGLWQRRLAGAADVIGSQLFVNDVPATIIGVTPPGFFGAEVGRAFDVLLPIGDEPLIRGDSTFLTVGGPPFLTVMLRLKPDQSNASATATIRGLQRPMFEAAMGALPEAERERALQDFLREPFVLERGAAGISLLRERYERPLLVLLGVVGLVLLIACANIANLLLARGHARSHEFGIRLALGASRWRLARQLLVESAVLAGLGASLGVLAGVLISRTLVTALSTAADHVVLVVPLDWRVLAFAAALLAATVALFGVAPSLRAARVSPIDSMKASGLRGDRTNRTVLSGGLVILQVALSLVVVVAAGLLVRSFERLTSVSLGFDLDPVLVVKVNASQSSTAPANRLALYQHLADAVGAVPGVAHAAASQMTPIDSGLGVLSIITVPDAPDMPEPERAVPTNFISSEWLAAYGMPLLDGRNISDQDTGAASPVALVNEAFIKKFVPDGHAVGRLVLPTFAPPGQLPKPIMIIGTVRNAVFMGLREGAPPTLYVPLAQWSRPRPPAQISISVRSATASPRGLVRPVAAALSEVDPGLTFSFRPLADQVTDSIKQDWLTAMLSGLLGALSLLLAALGLYGVTTHAVGQRRREIGIRMALGAPPGIVVGVVLQRVALLVCVGLVIGSVASVWASHFVGALLFDITPGDPATLAGSMVVLTGVAGLAAAVPAWHAARIDPAVVLRNE